MRAPIRDEALRSTRRDLAQDISSVDQNQFHSTSDLLERLGDVEDELDELRAQLTCRRCMEPAPTVGRWGGDPWSRDTRPPMHTCGKARWVA